METTFTGSQQVDQSRWDDTEVMTVCWGFWEIFKVWESESVVKTDLSSVWWTGSDCVTHRNPSSSRRVDRRRTGSVFLWRRRSTQNETDSDDIIVCHQHLLYQLSVSLTVTQYEGKNHRADFDLSFVFSHCLVWTLTKENHYLRRFPLFRTMEQKQIQLLVLGDVTDNVLFWLKRACDVKDQAACWCFTVTINTFVLSWHLSVSGSCIYRCVSN